MGPSVGLKPLAYHVLPTNTVRKKGGIYDANEDSDDERNQPAWPRHDPSKCAHRVKKHAD